MPLFDLDPVVPVAPPAAYLGGKRSLARHIAAKIKTIAHGGYAEMFVGMGGVFFRRDLAPRTEVINDVSGDVANLFRILQRHYPQFMETLRFQLTSRREFERLAATDPSTLTDLERAARFLYLQRTGYAGKVRARSFGIDARGGARFNLTKLAPLLEEVHERLSGVVIEQLDWREFVDRWDRPGMLFYADPPYHGSETDYGKGVFGRADFGALAERLGGLKGRFILSINDVPEIREMFAAFTIEPVSLTYTAARHAGTEARELIISG